VTTPEAMLLARTAETWHTTPSSLLRLEGVVGLALDEVLAVRLHKARTNKGAEPRANNPLPAGYRYETPADALMVH
jgi:hypothetical protein